MIDKGVQVANQGSDPLYMEEYRPQWAPVLAIVLPLLPFFWNYRVRVTKQIVTFGYNYAIVAKTVDRAGIQAAEPVEINPLFQWGGWGLRLRRAEGKWQTGYISKGGSGVKLTVNEEGKDSVYVFSCEDPKLVCDILSPEKNEILSPENEIS